MNAKIQRIINHCQNKKDSKLKPEVFAGISDFTTCQGSVNAVNQESGWQIKSFDFPEIWSQTKGQNVKVAVLDTGVDISHPDLNIKKSLDFVNINKSNWWDDKENKVKVSDIDYSSYTPLQPHGTHVSGIIGAIDNDIGMIGVAPECDIYALRVLNESGSGYYSDMAIALLWCIYNEDIDIINMSLGGLVGDKGVWEALKLAYDEGIIVVCAAGNEYLSYNYKGYISFPAQYEETISVAAMDVSGDRASFSSVGPNIDVAAPGVGILSTVLNNQYATYSGTCISGRCKVYTKRGPVYIKDVLIGDEVFTMNSDYQIKLNKCENILSNGMKDVYKIKSSNREVVATDNHPFLCLNKQVSGGGDVRKRYARSFEWKELKDIVVGDFIVAAKNIVCEDDNIEFSNELCQFVGAYLGDGNLFFDKRRNSEEEYGFDLNIKYGLDRSSDLPGKYSDIIKKCFCCDVNNYDGILKIYSKDVAKKVKELGLSGNAHNKRIPEWCYSLTQDKKLCLLAGLIDSDGTIKNEGYCQIELCNYDLLYDIKVFCEMIGLTTGKVRSRKRKIDVLNRGIEKEYISYMLTINCIDLFNIPIFDLESKRRIQNKSDNRVYIEDCSSKKYDFPENSYNKDIDIIRVKEIEKLDSQEEVFDLTIEENHNFIVDGVVVHNSMSAPFVSGLCALILSKHRKLGGDSPINSVEDMRRHICKFAVDDEEFLGKDIYMGWGIVNPKKYFEKERKPNKEPRVAFGRFYAGGIMDYNDQPWRLK